MEMPSTIFTDEIALEKILLFSLLDLPYEQIESFHIAILFAQ
jgi:hypothetical protein